LDIRLDRELDLFELTCLPPNILAGDAIARGVAGRKQSFHSLKMDAAWPVVNMAGYCQCYDPSPDRRITAGNGFYVLSWLR
jgi:hypothetical protein